MVKLLFCFRHPTFNSSCPLGKLERTELEQACYIACPEKCAEELCPKLNVYLSLGQVTQIPTCPTDKMTCLRQVDSVFFTPWGLIAGPRCLL